ncbi:MAG: hypothetical protein RSB99_04275 [Bacilli bacterium]
MYETIIGNYIKTMSTSDIQNYALEKGIQISDKDASTLLTVAKKHWLTFYKGDPSIILQDLKNKIDPTVYKAGIALYKEIKKKINQ